MQEIYPSGFEYGVYEITNTSGDFYYYWTENKNWIPFPVELKTKLLEIYGDEPSPYEWSEQDIFQGSSNIMHFCGTVLINGIPAKPTRSSSLKSATTIKPSKHSLRTYYKSKAAPLYKRDWFFMLFLSKLLFARHHKLLVAGKFLFVRHRKLLVAGKSLLARHYKPIVTGK